MSEQTAISWTDSTFNPWVGCTKVGPGCDHCYAETLMAKRYGRVEWGAGKARARTSVANWRKPLRWQRWPFGECPSCGWRGEYRQAAHTFVCGCGHKGLTESRRRVFCASLSDVFDNEVEPSWRADLFQLIERTPNLDWLVLTKRIGNVPTMMRQVAAHLFWIDHLDHPWLPTNVWLGATVVNQEEADRDIPKLLAVPARVRFLSIEPMLGPVNLDAQLFECCGNHEYEDHGCYGSRRVCCGKPNRRDLLDWVIAGGESGPGARPMRRDWVRSLRDQCAAAGVPFHFKQWGEHAPNWLTDDAGQEIPGSMWIDRMGKKIAGRTLDGMEHNGFPT